MLQTAGGGKQARRAALLAQGGTTAVLAFVASTALMHLVQPELDPMEVAVSYYMNGRLGWAIALGMVALGAGSLAIASGLRLLPETRDRTAALGALALWGVAVVVAGSFPPDEYGRWDQPPSPSGTTHGVAALIAFVALPIAALALSRPLGKAAGTPGRGRHLRALAVLGAVTLAVLLACLAPAFANRPPYLLGAVERALLALDLAWLLAAASSVRVAARGSGGGKSAPLAGSPPEAYARIRRADTVA